MGSTDIFWKDMTCVSDELSVRLSNAERKSFGSVIDGKIKTTRR